MKRKALHAELEGFFERPTRSGLKLLLSENLGETNNLDFKADWPERSHLARHLLALANSKGGVLVIGVDESEGTLKSIGLAGFMDKSDVSKQLETYLPHDISYEIANFAYGSEQPAGARGHHFQVIFVEDLPRALPFVCMRDGESCRRAAIYVRRGTESIEAGYTELQKALSRRIETQYSATRSIALDEHLDDLERLFSRIPRFVDIEELADRLEYAGPNPDYPDEGYEVFVRRLIESKKRTILELMDKAPEM